jgi:hypothetical protein
MKYIVNVKEVHNLQIVVEADSKTEAIKKANDAIANEDLSGCPLEYSHILDENQWGVELVR